MDSLHWLDWKHWRGMLVNSLLFFIVTFSLLVLIAATGWFSRPPFKIQNQDPTHLGVLCPGDLVPLRNRVTIYEPVINSYGISVLDRNGLYNLLGTQKLYLGYQHPRPGEFDQLFVWEVPELEPGEYRRTFSVRGVDTDEDTVFIENTFSIGKDCQS